jgi:uncharacterized protein YkwD
VVGRGPFLAFLLAGVLLAAGCQLTTSRPNPSHSPPQDARLTAADNQVLKGDYDAAEAAYRTLLDGRVPGAAAHLSTLLAYEGRFGEAVSQAQAGVAAHADSDSLARLTRALDWSQDIDGAVATGARAVAASPVEPLAHVYYSEALADAGRFDAAAAELRTAEDAGGDAFVQGEIDREWANYYRGRGDSQSELNYSELAARAQPAFPERQLDLIRYRYNNQRPDTARAIADKMLVAHPRDYRLLLAVADAALSGGDGVRAPALYRAAAQSRPDSPEPAAGLALLDIVVSHDFGSAHDRLVDALKRSPGSSSVYQFLRYVDLLALKKDPAADLGPIAPQPPDEVAADRRTALDQANARRAAAGVPALQADPALTESATAHAYYVLFNLGQPQLNGVGIYAEDPSLPGFTGAQALDRERHFGYSGSRAAELVDHSVTPQAGVGTWTDSVLQRLPLLDREATGAGYGLARVGGISISVLDLGSGPRASGDPIAYPPAAQAGVPAAFTDQEVPSSLPQGALTPAGYPVTLEVGGAQKLVVKTGRLLDGEGLEVPSYTLPPGDRLGQSQWALVPKQPLRPGGHYTAEVQGTIDGQDFSRRWSFTVVSP